MPGNGFDRDGLARWYADRHFKTDPGVQAIYYLPTSAPEREIRFLEVNDLIAERKDSSLEPLDFGVNVDDPNGHTLMVLDVTPSQWTRIEEKGLPLPDDWSMDGAVKFTRQA